MVVKDVTYASGPSMNGHTSGAARAQRARRQLARPLSPGRSDPHVIESELGAAHGVDYHTRRVGESHTSSFISRLSAHVAELVPSIRMWHHLRSLSHGM